MFALIVLNRLPDVLTNCGLRRILRCRQRVDAGARLHALDRPGDVAVLDERAEQYQQPVRAWLAT